MELHIYKLVNLLTVYGRGKKIVGIDDDEYVLVVERLEKDRRNKGTLNKTVFIIYLLQNSKKKKMTIPPILAPQNFMPSTKIAV